MEERVYHTKAIKESEFYSRFGFLFSEILDKDYPGKDFGFTQRVLDTLCLDMDAVEKDNAVDADRTMDCVVGVSDYDEQYKKHSGHRYMMVELKLKCKGFSMKSGYLREKVDHTVELLTGKIIDRRKVFIFPRDVVGSAKRVLMQWNRGTEKRFVADWHFLAPSEYNDFLRFAEDFPYEPVTKIEDVEKSFDILEDDADRIDLLVSRWNYWQELAVRYKNRGICEEYNHIIGIVNQLVRKIVGKMEEGDDKEFLRLEFQLKRKEDGDE